MPRSHALGPGLACGLAIFALGFAAGTVRVVCLAPHLGTAPALLMELPVMLLGVWLLARWAIRRWTVPRRMTPRLIMGGGAFAVLMACETALSVTLFGNSLSQHLARYLEPDARIGLAAQMVVIVMPALLLIGKDRP